MKNLITHSRWFEPSPFSAIRYISFISGIIALFTVAQWHWVKALGELGFYILLIIFYAGPLVAVDSLEQDTRKKIDEKENYISHLEAKIEEMKYENSTSNLQIQLDKLRDKEVFYKDEIKRLKSRVNHLLRG